MEANMSAAAFIYLAEGLAPERQRGVINSPGFEMRIFGVSSYEQACDVAKALVNTGTESIVLCAGFGYRGTAMVKAAVPGIPVATTKFDYHPGLGGSGDDVFQ